MNPADLLDFENNEPNISYDPFKNENDIEFLEPPAKNRRNEQIELGKERKIAERELKEKECQKIEAIAQNIAQASIHNEYEQKRVICVMNKRKNKRRKGEGRREGNGREREGIEWRAQAAKRKG